MLRHSIVLGEKFTGDISFKAEIRDDRIISLPEANIVFDKVIENDGFGYDRYSGIFTCPLGGEYFLSVSITNHKLKQLETELMVNNDVIMRVNTAARWLKCNQCSPGIVKELKLKDKVFVRIVSRDSEIDLYGGHHSTFIGFRIK